PRAQAGSAKTSRPTPAARLATANAPARPARDARQANGIRRPAAAPEGITRVARPARPARPARSTGPGRAPPPVPRTAVSSRPRSTRVYSKASEGTSTAPPTATPTMVATSVARSAAAWLTVRPGSSRGYWAAAQPAITVATASAAVARAG